MDFGLKKILNKGYRIITSDETTDKTLKNLLILILDKDGELKEKFSQNRLIFQNNNVGLSDVIMHNVENGLVILIQKKKILKFFQFTTTKKLIVYLKILIQCPF